ncbi:MAG: T9SS type A sorting domain-containing protein, partial [Flavobacteriales bacterium]
PPVEIIANPDPSGGNTSETVAKFTARVTGNPWAGCETNSNADLGPFVLDATNSTIKIMVWKPVISDVGIKLASPLGWAQSEIKVANTLVNQWEELTFDFSAYVNPPADQGQLSQIIVFPDFDLAGRTQENVIFFDKITYSAAQSNPEPMTAAPTPTQDPADVISLFSDAYTNVAVDTWITPWSQSAYADVTIQGNPTKRYANLNFAGIETIASQLDINEMTHFHVDVWSADFTLFAIKLVDFGADGGFGGGDDVEHQIDINAPAQQEWVSLDIPLSSFTGLVTQSNIAQYIIVAQPSGNATVWLDNMFFYNGDVVVEPEPTEPAPTPIQLQANVISMFSDAYTNVTVDTWATSWSAAALTDITIQGNPTKKYTNLDFVGVETVANTIDASGMEFFYLDMWSPNATFFAVKLVDFGADGAFGGGDDTEHQINIENPAQEEWVSVNLPLSSFTGLASTEHLAQYIFVGQPTGATTVYVDNVFFYKTPINVEDMENAGIPALYPNPVVAGQPVRFGDATCAIEIYDLSGRIVLTERAAVLQTNALSQGVYVVKLHAANGSTSTQRLTVK